MSSFSLSHLERIHSPLLQLFDVLIADHASNQAVILAHSRRFFPSIAAAASRWRQLHGKGSVAKNPLLANSLKTHNMAHG